MAVVTCPTDCSSNLPPVAFSNCAPVTPASEIYTLYIGKGDDPGFDDWTDVEEWGTKVSATLTTAGTIRPLIGTGDKPVPAAVTKVISNGRTQVTTKNHTLNFTVDEANATNHEFIRNLECGGIYTIWYKTRGQRTFGGDPGIKVSLQANMQLDRGDEGTQLYQLIFTWQSKVTEEMEDSVV